MIQQGLKQREARQRKSCSDTKINGKGGNPSWHPPPTPLLLNHLHPPSLYLIAEHQTLCVCMCEREMNRRLAAGSGGGNGGVPTDLLVCFPSRAHLKLMAPKPICSPSRPTDTTGKRHLTRTSTVRGQASPLFKGKAKNMSSEISEPTSPKVTCAGQIKVRPKPRSRTKPDSGAGKDWLTVVEEIERLHNQKKKSNWLESIGLKKEIAQLLGALRGLRFRVGCFGALHGAVDCTTDEEDGEEEEEEAEEEKEAETGETSTVFSKWFMVLEENQSLDLNRDAAVEEEDEEEFKHEEGGGIVEKESTDRFEEVSAVAPPSGPPPNALLLMRCSSAPAKGWQKKTSLMVLMGYDPDFKISMDIVKETWVVGCVDPLSRSRSCRR